MVVMDYSISLDCDIEKFFEILTNYENLPKYLPRQLKKIEIVNETDNYKTIRATIFIPVSYTHLTLPTILLV